MFLRIFYSIEGLMIFLFTSSYGMFARLEVSSPVLSGEEATLECLYGDLSVSEYSELDIKWYFNRTDTPFMVELPFLQGRPQVVEESYERHIRLPRQRQHLTSRFTLTNTSPNLSGVYTCTVSTFSREIIRMKKIMIT